jgi:prepilin-type processing-associated H-X9-DG protein
MWMGELSPDITIDDHFHFVDKAKAIPGDAAAYYPNSFFSQVDVRRHQGSANYLFVDSHVESLSWTHVKPMLKQVGCRFVKPDGHQ